MGWNDYIGDLPLRHMVEQCPFCHKFYKCHEEEQVPGCRELDQKICPYCHSEISASMTYEYECKKLSDDEIAFLKGNCHDKT